MNRNVRSHLVLFLCFGVIPSVVSLLLTSNTLTFCEGLLYAGVICSGRAVAYRAAPRDSILEHRGGEVREWEGGLRGILSVRALLIKSGKMF